MSKINLELSHSSGFHEVQSATELVRVKIGEGACFHVALLENNTVEVYVASQKEKIAILDLENASEPQVENIELAKALSSKSDLTLTEKALAIVQAFPYRTSRELAAKVNPNIITAEQLHKRLSDLMRKCIVRQVSVRECAVSGTKAVTWAPVNA